MYIPLALTVANESGPPPIGENSAPQLESLTSAVNCGLCGIPIRTVQELELVASSAVHVGCLRHVVIMGWQLANHVMPDNSV